MSTISSIHFKNSKNPFCDFQEFLELSKQNKIFIQEIEPMEKIACGASGNVFTGQMIRNRKKYLAIKHIRHDSKLYKKIDHKTFKKMVFNEAIIIQNVSSKYVCRSLGLYDFGPNSYALVLELAHSGNFKEFISKFERTINKNNDKRYFKTISESLIGYVSYSMVLALKHLYYLYVIHGDLKPENILIYENFEIKLSDFTLSHKLDNANSFHKFNGNGTKCYNSPENITKMEVPNKECYKTDLFSLGVFMYKSLQGHYPFEIKSYDDNKIINYKIRNEEIKFRKDIKISLEIKDLISRLLEPNYEKRISIEQLLNHKWFINFGSLKNYNDKYSDTSKFITDLYHDDVEGLLDNLNF